MLIGIKLKARVMKIVTSKQMADLEAQAYRNGSSEKAFMEEAGKGVALATERFVTKNHLAKVVTLLCGKGNNAGDAYVAGCYLLEHGYDVLSIQIPPITESSKLCQKNHKRFQSKGGIVNDMSHLDEMRFPKKGIILDGIFGTGFHGVAREPYASLIHAANQAFLPILAIDIPSGLNGDTGVVEGEAIQGKETFFLALPKEGFFLQDGWNHVGKLRYVDFGLPHEYIEEFEAEMLLLTAENMKPLFPPLVNNRHKYQAGFVVGLGGSPGMPGAAIMASISALKSGAGIVKLASPKGMEGELASSPYEVIRVSFGPHDGAEVREMMNSSTATFIGPGIGKSSTMRALLKEVLENLKKPCVIDADALTIIAEDHLKIPEQAILTPHVGEMMRLLRDSVPKPGTKAFLHLCQEYAEEHRITLVLKGGPTFIFHPNEPVMVNGKGDPGMATAGSGDVLTGVITALLAQGLSTRNAACLGVYLHAVAGEHAAEEMTSYCMSATDIITHLPKAFRE